MKTLLDYRKLEKEVERLTTILKENGIDPTTGKTTKVEAVEPPVSINLKGGKAVITRH